MSISMKAMVERHKVITEQPQIRPTLIVGQHYGRRDGVIGKVIRLKDGRMMFVYTVRWRVQGKYFIDEYGNPTDPYVMASPIIPIPIELSPNPDDITEEFIIDLLRLFMAMILATATCIGVLDIALTIIDHH